VRKSSTNLRVPINAPVYYLRGAMSLIDLRVPRKPMVILLNHNGMEIGEIVIADYG
jgi:hypothetical protein